jgi:hypothetical protein
MPTRTFAAASAEFFATMRRLRKKQLTILHEYSNQLAKRKEEKVKDKLKP